MWARRGIIGTPLRTPFMASQLPIAGRGSSAEGSGTCPVCRRPGIKVVKSSGLLRRHGPHDNPCTGHNLPPVPGSFMHAAPGPTSTRASQASADDTSADLFDSSASAPDPSSRPPYPRYPHPQASAQGCSIQCIDRSATSCPGCRAGSPEFR